MAVCRECKVELNETNRGSKNRNWCKSCRNRYMRNWSKTDKALENNRRVQRKLRKSLDHRKKVSERQKTYQQKIRAEVINHYSKGTMACTNPFGIHKEPFTIMEALSMDHINHIGGDRKKRQRKNLSAWLRSNGFPDGFQVLCMNCQFIKMRRNREYRKPAL